jgi:gliding motility-associated peptidyl-prolyl isomerase
MRKIALLFLIFFVHCSCEKQKPRRPISQTSNNFINESITRNKKLNKSEEDIIAAIIKSKPSIKFNTSKKGYWYYYMVKNEEDTLSPRKGDVANFDYEIRDIKEQIIYSQTELGNVNYKVDKEEIMIGLRDAIKLMHQGEKITFIFPSHIAYGYHGDNKKIGPNVPLICNVTLNNFKKDITPEKKQVKKIIDSSQVTKKKNTEDSSDKEMVKEKKPEKKDEAPKEKKETESKKEVKKVDKPSVKKETKEEQKKEIPSEIKID